MKTILLWLAHDSNELIEYEDEIKQAVGEFRQSFLQYIILV